MARQHTTTPLAIGPAKVADKIGVANSTVLQLLRNGELPGFKIGKRWLIPVKALEAWIETRAAGR